MLATDSSKIKLSPLTACSLRSEISNKQNKTHKITSWIMASSMGNKNQARVKVEGFWHSTGRYGSVSITCKPETFSK